MNTSWSKPRRNFLAGINCLRRALSTGMNAKLIRVRNEDCDYPILIKNEDKDFRNFEFSIAYIASQASILADSTLSEFQKYLSLNYVTLYGQPEAVDHYYETGELSADNHCGIGTSHLVRVTDLVEMLKLSGDKDQIAMYELQYLTPGYENDKYFFSFYRYNYGSMYATRKFRRKLWVVALLNDEPKPRTPVLVHVLNAVLNPMKYLPTRHVLKMDNYRVVTYRIGSIVNGFSVEFHVPKKFGFTNERN